jgi:hypothetical protein
MAGWGSWAVGMAKAATAQVQQFGHDYLDAVTSVDEPDSEDAKRTAKLLFDVDVNENSNLGGTTPNRPLQEAGGSTQSSSQQPLHTARSPDDSAAVTGNSGASAAAPPAKPSSRKQPPQANGWLPQELNFAREQTKHLLNLGRTVVDASAGAALALLPEVEDDGEANRASPTTNDRGIGAGSPQAASPVSSASGAHVAKGKAPLAVSSQPEKAPDGWGNDWDDEDDEPVKPVAKVKHQPAATPSPPSRHANQTAASPVTATVTTRNGSTAGPSTGAMPAIQPSSPSLAAPSSAPAKGTHASSVVQQGRTAAPSPQIAAVAVKQAPDEVVDPLEELRVARGAALLRDRNLDNERQATMKHLRQIVEEELDPMAIGEFALDDGAAIASDLAWIGQTSVGRRIRTAGREVAVVLGEASGEPAKDDELLRLLPSLPQRSRDGASALCGTVIDEITSVLCTKSLAAEVACEAGGGWFPGRSASQAPGSETEAAEFAAADQEQRVRLCAQRVRQLINYAQCETAAAAMALCDLSAEALQYAKKANLPDLKRIKDEALSVRSDCYLMAAGEFASLEEAAECAVALIPSLVAVSPNVPQSNPVAVAPQEGDNRSGADEVDVR